MFELSVLNSFKTVGAFILYKDTLAFMIGSDNTGEKLGITRLGGHIEEKESYLQALLLYFYPMQKKNPNLHQKPVA